MLKRIIASLIVLLVIVSVLPNGVFAADESSQIDSIIIIREKNDYRLAIKASIAKSHSAIISSSEGSFVYLFQLNPYDVNVSLNSLNPVDRVKVSSTIAFTIDFDINSDMLYSKYVLAYKKTDGTYQDFTSEKYIDNPQLLANNSKEFPTFYSKKGLCIQDLTSAEELGVSQTIINVPLNEYICLAEGSTTYEYTYGGETYYIDGRKLDYLDCKVRSLTAANVNCYIDFILTELSNENSDGVESFYFTEDFSTNAEYYGINVTTKKAARSIEAFVSFVSERYSRDDGKYGFVGNYILGYKVNDSRSYNYCGGMDFDSNTYFYATAFRLFNNAVLSNYSNAKTYISLGNNYNTIYPDSTATIADGLIDYSSKAYLDRFMSIMKRFGEMPYNVAITCTTSDGSTTDFRSDELCTDGEDTPYISLKNIDVLINYLSSKENLYNGKARTILINNFAIGQGESEELQAAMYAYAYLLVNNNSAIDGLIYGKQFDEAKDVNKYGIWSADEKTGVIIGTKKIYDVFKYIDTKNASDHISFALGLLGYENWNDALSKKVTFDNKQIFVGQAEIQSTYENKNTLFNFSQDNLLGFEPFDYVDYIEYKNDETFGSSLDVKAHFSGDKEDYSGAGIQFDNSMSISGAGKIVLSIAPYCSNQTETFDVMLRLYSFDGNATYEGVVYGISCTPTTINYDISQFARSAKKIDSVKILIKPSSSSEADYTELTFGYQLYGFSVQDRGIAVFFAVIKWIAIILLVLVLVTLILRIINNSIKKRRKKIIESQKNPFRDNSGKMVRPNSRR